MEPRPLTEKQALWSLALIGLATRLPLLSWFTTETTDGVLCLTYFQWKLFALPRFVLFPGYPFLISLGHGVGLGEIEWGRCLAAGAGLLVTIPVWRLARRWASVEISFLMSLAYLLSPLGWMWSLRVMPDTLFLCLFWFAAERALAFEESSGWKRAAALSLLSLGAFLVRPEGLVLVAAVVWLLARRSGYRLGAAGLGLAALGLGASWPIRLFLLKSFGAFQEGATGVEDPLSHLGESLWTYLTQPAWVFSPVLFFMAVGGLFALPHRTDTVGVFWRRRLLPLLAVLFVLKWLPTNYQDRHLLPFLPAVCILAAYKLQELENGWAARCDATGRMVRRNGLAGLTLCYLIGFSLVVFAVQRDSFGDLARNAEYLKTLPADAVVYSDEQFKTIYGSDRYAIPWTPEVRDLKPGTFLVFHTFYTPRLRHLEETLSHIYELEVVRRDYAVTIPVLTDLMMDPALQNRPQAASRRFEPQSFETRVYRVVRVKNRARAKGLRGGA